MKILIQLSFIVIFLCSTGCNNDPDFCDLPPEQCHVYQDSDELVCQQFEDDITNISAELEDYIYGFSSSNPNDPKSELDALGQVVGDKYFVGLGEATHGTFEFFQMKDRIFRYLVENHGFKAIGFEATWGGALYVNRYVLHGEGNAKDAVTKMQFWTWQTEEVVALVEWMHSYNLGKEEEDKIFFYGVDMQSGSEEKYWINEYLEKYYPGISDQIIPALSAFLMVDDYDNYPNLTQEQRMEYRDGIQASLEAFRNNKDQLVPASGEKEYELIEKAFDVMLQYEEYLYSDNKGSLRDFHMAKNSEWVRDYIGDDPKIALWAHNAHIAKQYTYQTQGVNLANWYGDKYSCIGFSFSTGSFQAVQYDIGLTTNNNLIEPYCGSVGAILSETSQNNFYLIFDEIEEGSQTYDYFNETKRAISIGAVFTPSSINNYYRPTVLAKTYDIYIHFDHTQSAIPY